VESAAPDGIRELGLVDARERGPVRQPRIEERLGLCDSHRGHVPPEPRRAIQRAHDDRHDQDHEADPEDRRLEDREGTEPLQHVDEPRTEDRVVADVDVLDGGRIVARRAEREVRKLLECHPDHGQDRQEDDLDDREIDRRQQPPDPLAELGERVGRGGGGARRRGGSRRGGR
jgi:hypothetical protein